MTCLNDGQVKLPLLYFAVRTDEPEMVQALLDAGCDANQKMSVYESPISTSPIETPQIGFTVLHLSASSSGAESQLISAMILEHGGILEEEDGEMRTPLHYAAMNNEAVARLLVERGASLLRKDKQRNTPLWYAADKGHLSTVRLLSGQPTQRDLRDAAKIAVENGFDEILVFLIGKGLQVNLTDHDGQNLLHTAAGSGQTECCRALLRTGVAPDQSDSWGVTPLMMACVATETGRRAHRERLECIELLLRKGADPNTQIKSGKTCLHLLAQEVGEPEHSGFAVTAITLLLKAGANPNLRFDGKTALDVVLEESPQTDDPDHGEDFQRATDAIRAAGGEASQSP